MSAAAEWPQIQLDEPPSDSEMNFSLTVPQLFYDFIARVLPGFLFLVALQLCLAGTEFDLLVARGSEERNWVGSLLEGFGFAALCYFCGLLLRSFAFPDRQPRDRTDTTQFREKYHRVRLAHEASGFRVLKLRAEARLLQASRAGMWLVALIAILACIGSNVGVLRHNLVSDLGWTLRVVLPLLIGLVFLKQEGSAWKTYCGNVDKLHQLIVDEGLSKKP